MMSTHHISSPFDDIPINENATNSDETQNGSEFTERLLYTENGQEMMTERMHKMPFVTYYSFPLSQLLYKEGWDVYFESRSYALKELDDKYAKFQRRRSDDEYRLNVVLVMKTGGAPPINSETRNMTFKYSLKDIGGKEFLCEQAICRNRCACSFISMEEICLETGWEYLSNIRNLALQRLEETISISMAQLYKQRRLGYDHFHTKSHTVNTRLANSVQKC